MPCDLAPKLFLIGKWIELEKIILSEVTQTQKDKHGCEGIKREPKLREWPTNDLPNWRPMPWTKANP